MSGYEDSFGVGDDFLADFDVDAAVANRQKSLAVASAGPTGKHGVGVGTDPSPYSSTSQSKRVKTSSPNPAAPTNHRAGRASCNSLNPYASSASSFSPLAAASSGAVAASSTARSAARGSYPWLASTLRPRYSQIDIKHLPRAIDKRRRGRYVKYLIVPVGKTRKKAVWKKNKDMSSDEKEACRKLREDTGETGARREQLANKEHIKANAMSYVDAAARGDTKTIDRLELQWSLSELEKDLAESVNFAKTRTDVDIGDWGNVKQSVDIFEDTPLISAIRCHDVAAVHALLRSGLCDPTLQICPHDFIGDRYTMYESDKKDAMIISKNTEKELLATYKKKAADVRIYDYGRGTFRKGIKAKAAKEAAKIVRKVENATQIVALVEVASSMWPKATYCSPQRSCGKGKDRAKHTNRMHGATDEASQMEVTERLRQRLASAIENCLLEPIDEAAIASVIEKANVAEEA